MKTKILVEFGLSLCISLCSLLVVAVPKAHAAQAAWSGGFQMFAQNPLVTMAITVVASGLLIWIARHYNKVNS
jgi:hypothetical protein